MKLMARLAGTFYESLYGKEQFDVLIVGDDPLVSLSAAAQLSQAGKRILLAPDTLESSHWPAEDWGQMMLAIQNHYEPEISQELNSRLNGLHAKHTYLGALSGLIRVCAESKSVMVMEDCLQSSKGHVKGSTPLIFFPARADQCREEKINPMWSMVTRKVPTLKFCFEEIEFIETQLMLYTTPVPSRIDASLGTAIGQARKEKGDLAEGGRLDDVKSAFSNFYRSN